jgi:hypothetical protein
MGTIHKITMQKKRSFFIMHYHQYYNSYPPFQINRQQPQYPSVDISIFEHSVTAFQKIANEAIIILKMFANPQFAFRLMTLAQAGKQMEVDRLIKSIGTSTPVTTQYTPTGILLTIHAQAQDS